MRSCWSGAAVAWRGSGSALPVRLVGRRRSCFTNDLLRRTHGHSFFDNMDTVYPPAVNEIVDRYVATPDARNYLQHYYTPSGDLPSRC